VISISFFSILLLLVVFEFLFRRILFMFYELIDHYYGIFDYFCFCFSFSTSSSSFIFSSSLFALYIIFFPPHSPHFFSTKLSVQTLLMTIQTTSIYINIFILFSLFLTFLFLCCFMDFINRTMEKKARVGKK
jgi:hypothetical protein